MKRILNVLFVRRPEVENKWWNRFFNVLLGSTSIIILLVAFSFTYKPIDPYAAIMQKYGYIAPKPPISDEQDFSDFINKQGKYAASDTSASKGSLSAQEIATIRTSAGFSAVPPPTPVPGGNDIIAQRRAALGMDLAPVLSAPAPATLVQVIRNIATRILISILASLVWIIFWSSIVYRSILYVIFGKNGERKIKN